MKLLTTVPLLLAACASTGSDTGAASSETPDSLGSDGAVVRIVAWNIETLGSQGSAQWALARDVLARIDADVVGLNEVDEFEDDELQSLADALGYTWTRLPTSNPFGPLRNAMMTRLEVTRSTTWDSAMLSGDPGANDLTRLPVSVTVRVGGLPLTVAAMHWKSGFDDVDQFRRAVDGARVGQMAEQISDLHTQQGAPARLVVMGDFNAELDDAPEQPDPWVSTPRDLPTTYTLGDDMGARLDGAGLRNSPFVPLLDLGLAPANAVQLDGRDATRDSSGRRLDYVFTTPMGTIRSDVYDSRDDDGSGIADGDTVPGRDASRDASDHFPVVVEITL